MLVWLGGLDLISSEGIIWEPVGYKGDSSPAVPRGTGVHVAIQTDPVEVQFPYRYRSWYCAAFHDDTAILNSAREGHIAPTHPQQ